MLYPYKTHLIVYACVVMYIPMCSNIVLVLKVKILVHVKNEAIHEDIHSYLCMHVESTKIHQQLNKYKK